MILSLAADSPLLVPHRLEQHQHPHQQYPITELEIAHTTFVTTQAHQACLIMSLRLLDTGVAKDVSGILRVTMGGGGGGGRSVATGSNGADDDHDDGDEIGKSVAEGEWLYLVGRAGAGDVRVFERGAGLGIN